ncbi:flippase [Patescibacteria group bacterium]|nr:flippase [Patescibacteria group bacterium]
MLLSDLTNNPGFKKYFANTGWLFVGRIIQIIVGLLVGVYIVRYLGPSQYGLLNYAIAFVGLFSPIASLGLDGIIVRELVKTPQKMNELLGTVFFLKLVGVILMFGGVIAGMCFLGNDNFTNILIIIIASSYIFQAFNVVDFNFQATVKSRYVIKAQMMQLVISSFFKLFLIWSQASLLWFAAASLIDVITLTIGLLWQYKKNVGRVFAWRFRLKIAKSLLKDSWPLILSGIAITLYMKIDQIIIKVMLGNEEVGFYAVAVRLSEVWYFIPIAAISSLFPAIINAKKKSEELYHLRLQQLYDLMVWIAVAIALPVTFLSPFIIKTLYGDSYLPAASVLSIYIWAGVFVFLGVVSSQWLIAENFTKISFLGTFVGATINLILNFILIPKYGINGAAIATLISYFVAVFFIGLIPRSRKQAIFMLKSINPLGVIVRILKNYK